MGIIVVGLGPGGSRYLTREAWQLLSTAQRCYVRTERHPVVSELRSVAHLDSFDHLYESKEEFEDVYSRIVATLLESGRAEDIIYAVPGHPHVGESTVARLLREVRRLPEPLPVRIVSGLSFVEPVLTALNIDALDGLQVYDALAIAAAHYPSLHADAPVLLGQLYNRFVAAEVKLALTAIYPEEHLIYLVHGAGEEQEVVEALPLYEVDRSQNINHLSSLFIPALPAASTLPALAETVAVLRSPQGCPWDIEQTSQSMRAGFLEEAYEVLDAIDQGNADNLREELGDLLYHIVMQAQIAHEEGEFSLSDVIAGIESKLKRRHPHVWGDWEVNSTDEVLRNWEALKKQEKRVRGETFLLDDILANLPALARSQKIQERVGKAGFDWPDVSGVYDKLQEEISELQAAQEPEERQAELGDLLFALVNLARHYGLDAESALREANVRFERRFRIVESLARERSLNFHKLSLVELDALWEEAKVTLAKAAWQD